MTFISAVIEHRVVDRFALARKALLVVAMVIAAGVGPSASRAASSPGTDIADFTLANGLEVVVIPDHRVPVVTHMIWYRVGAADEPAGKSGIAHFLEHLMFKGTEKNPAGAFSQTLAKLGGQENAFTSSDYTAFFQRVAKEHLQTVMDFEADRMTGLVLTDENVLRERDVVLEEYNMRIANSPEARFGEQIAAALYLNHPYGRPVIGWLHEIEALNREDALTFYRRFYAPSNAVVVVAGDVTADEVKALAEATYGKVVANAPMPRRQRPQEPEQNAIRQLTFADQRVAQPSLQRSYLVPSYATAKPGEAESLDVLAQILGGGQTGRLYKALVEERGLAIGAGAWYSGSALDMTRFGVYATPLPNVSLHDLEVAIDDVVSTLAEKGVTTDELDRIKTQLIADSVYARDNQATLARLYGGALTTGSTVAAVQAWPDRVRDVTPESVRAAANAWLDKRRSVTGYLVKDWPKHEDKRS